MSKVSDKVAAFASRLNELEKEWLAIKNEVEGQFVQMKLQLEIADKSKPEDAPCPKVKSQAKEQSGNFPYPVGLLVKVAFPELFRRRLVNAGDIAYLLSKKATKDFRTRGYAVLRLYVGEDDPGLYACGHRRFYKMPPLELGSKKYNLSSQFYPESRDAVLKWIYSHGIKKNDLISLIEHTSNSNG